jgi:hypothetical protein
MWSALAATVTAPLRARSDRCRSAKGKERKGKEKRRRNIFMTVVWMLNLSTKCRANELHFSL